MDASLVINKTLKEQVLVYLRDQMRRGCLSPGEKLNLRAISQSLGLSITPLRDALLQLEVEGFVEIQPRRGIYITELNLKDFKDLYEIIGVLEHTAIRSIRDRITPELIDRLMACNQRLKTAIQVQDIDQIYLENLNFHALYLDFCENPFLLKTLRTLRLRLFDFPRMRSFSQDWWESSWEEHQRFIEFLTEGQVDQAADFMQKVHFAFDYQEHYVHQYHFPAGKKTHPIF